MPGCRPGIRTRPAQEAELQAAGAVRVFVDQGESSRLADRPQWVACLDYLRADDTLLVRSLDRLAGTTTMAIQTITDLGERGINIKSLTEPDIDTTAPMGRALFGMVAVSAQLRVDTIRKNTRRGLAAARAQGRVGGRPTVMTPECIQQAVRRQAEGKSLLATHPTNAERFTARWHRSQHDGAAHSTIDRARRGFRVGPRELPSVR